MIERPLSDDIVIHVAPYVGDMIRKAYARSEVEGRSMAGLFLRLSSYKEKLNRELVSLLEGNCK